MKPCLQSLQHSITQWSKDPFRRPQAGLNGQLVCLHRNLHTSSLGSLLPSPLHPGHGPSPTQLPKELHKLPTAAMEKGTRKNWHTFKPLCGTENAAQPRFSAEDEILPLHDYYTCRESAWLLVLLAVHIWLDSQDDCESTSNANQVQICVSRCSKWIYLKTCKFSSFADVVPRGYQVVTSAGTVGVDILRFAPLGTAMRKVRPELKCKIFWFYFIRFEW